MDTKYIILLVVVLLILVVCYKYRNKISNFFYPKKKELFLTSNNETERLLKPVEKQQEVKKEDLFFLEIYVSPSENEEYPLGKILVKLYDDIVPKTCENFKSLLKIEYKNCVIHRVIPEFMLQTGDYENGDGTGGASIYGKKFDDENFTVKHTKKGLLSMANSGPNTNGSQFFITFKETPWLDDKHVVFGEVVDGFDILDKIEKIPTDQNDYPKQLLYIKNCGMEK